VIAVFLGSAARSLSSLIDSCSRVNRRGSIKLAKAAILAFILGLALFDDGDAAAQELDPWFGRDKALHFTLSAALSIGGYAAAKVATGNRFGEAPINGFAFSLALGLAKEAYDAIGPGTPSYRDMVANLAGALAGLLLARLLDSIVDVLAAEPRAVGPVRAVPQ
jgi:putative lipoprotein